MTKKIKLVCGHTVKKDKKKKGKGNTYFCHYGCGYQKVEEEKQEWRC